MASWFGNAAMLNIEERILATRATFDEPEIGETPKDFREGQRACILNHLAMLNGKLTRITPNKGCDGNQFSHGYGVEYLDMEEATA